MSRLRRPTHPAAIKQRVRAVVRLRQTHNQASIYFRNDLEIGIDACRSRTTTANAVAAIAETLVVRKCRQLDRRFTWIVTLRLDTDWVRAAHKPEGFLTATVPVIL